MGPIQPILLTPVLLFRCAKILNWRPQQCSSFFQVDFLDDLFPRFISVSDNRSQSSRTKADDRNKQGAQKRSQNFLLQRFPCPFCLIPSIQIQNQSWRFTWSKVPFTSFCDSQSDANQCWQLPPLSSFFFFLFGT
jgi:hypothetical protein